MKMKSIELKMIVYSKLLDSFIPTFTFEPSIRYAIMIKTFIMT